MLDGTYYFDCVCGKAEHTLRFTLNKEQNEIYAEVYLLPCCGFFKRIYLAIKYVFGFNFLNGHFDDWIMDNNDAKKLRDMLNTFMGVEENAKEDE